MHHLRAALVYVLAGMRAITCRLPYFWCSYKTHRRQSEFASFHCRTLASMGSGNYHDERGLAQAGRTPAKKDGV